MSISQLDQRLGFSHRCNLRIRLTLGLSETLDQAKLDLESHETERKGDGEELPGKDSNLECLNQNQKCCHYTTG